MDNIIIIILDIIAALVVITLYEFSKAIVSVKLGDNTPKIEGRLTLNPLKHIDPIGLILLLVWKIGWSKPINTNATNYKNRKKGTVIVAITGILTNLIFAFILTFLFYVIRYNFNQTLIQSYILNFISSCVIYSVTIAVFNLIPVSPFAMSKILSVYSPRTYFKMIQYETLILIILMLVIFFGGASYIIRPIVNLIINAFNSIFSLIIV